MPGVALPEQTPERSPGTHTRAEQRDIATDRVGLRGPSIETIQDPDWNRGAHLSC